MTTQEKIEKAEARIKELQLLINHWEINYQSKPKSNKLITLSKSIPHLNNQEAA